MFTCIPFSVYSEPLLPEHNVNSGSSIANVPVHLAHASQKYFPWFLHPAPLQEAPKNTLQLCQEVFAALKASVAPDIAQALDRNAAVALDMIWTLLEGGMLLLIGHSSLPEVIEIVRARLHIVFENNGEVEVQKTSPLYASQRHTVDVKLENTDRFNPQHLWRRFLKTPKNLQAARSQFDSLELTEFVLQHMPELAQPTEVTVQEFLPTMRRTLLQIVEDTLHAPPSAEEKERVRSNILQCIIEAADREFGQQLQQNWDPVIQQYSLMNPLPGHDYPLDEAKQMELIFANLMIRSADPKVPLKELAPLIMAFITMVAHEGIEFSAHDGVVPTRGATLEWIGNLLNEVIEKRQVCMSAYPEYAISQLVICSQVHSFKFIQKVLLGHAATEMDLED